MSDLQEKPVSDEELMELARQRVKIKSKLLAFIIAYIPFNAVMALIWSFTSSDSFWPKWVMLGTGLLLVIYGVFAFIELTNTSNFASINAEYKRLKQAAELAENEQNANKD